MSVEEQLSRSQWAAFIRGLTIFDGADWVNHPQATYQAESKPYQLRYAAKLGFQIPATLITNDSAAVSCRQVGDPFVIKSVDTVLLRDGDDEVFAYSSIVSCSEIVDEEFYEVPSTCQQLLQPKLDLRITIIGDDFYCISITNEGRQIDGDWRLTAKDKLTYREHSLPEEDKKRCVDLVKGLGLRFGAIDLALTPSGLFFIEINPTGEWGWLNEALRPIASNIAHFLAKPRSTVT